jgi:cytochrome c oxidase assembly protein subunit 15
MVQGAFGALTVTLKLQPAVVSLHLLGAMVLLGLLVCQREAYLRRSFALPLGLRVAGAVVLGLLGLQMALGAWVSTNYAVLACQGFPQCNGDWWPAADFEQGFSLWRGLGRAAGGGYIGADSLVGIHLVHRAGALVFAVASLGLAGALWARGGVARRYAQGVVGLICIQVASGIGNVVLGWPLPVALLHTAGAAALTGLLVSLLFRSRPADAATAGPLSSNSTDMPWART